MDLSVFSDSAEGPYPSQLVIVIKALWILTSLLCVFVFSVCEYTLFSLTKNEKEKLMQTKSLEYHSLKKLLSDERWSISAIMTSYYLSASSFALSVIVSAKDTLSDTLTSTQTTIISIAAIFILLMLFGESIPSRLRNSNKHKFSLLYYFAPIVRCFSNILYPLVWLVNKTTLAEKRLEFKCRRSISIDELSHTLHSSSIADDENKNILESIVTFGQVSVDEIKRPRVEVVAIDIKKSYDEVLRVIRESEYSRMPIYDNSIDNVVGILYVKDLLPHIKEKSDFKWQELIRDPYYVPESKKIDDLLREFQVKRMHMAIVVDEFGGTSGIVTMEDILEVIFGDINDEHDTEQKLYSALDKRNYLFEGKLLLSDFYRIPGIEAEKFADIETDADTIAGLMLELCGAIPKVGEEIKHADYLFKIVSVDNRRIKKIKLRLPDKE